MRLTEEGAKVIVAGTGEKTYKDIIYKNELEKIKNDVWGYVKSILI